MRVKRRLKGGVACEVCGDDTQTEKDAWCAGCYADLQETTESYKDLIKLSDSRQVCVSDMIDQECFVYNGSIRERSNVVPFYHEAKSNYMSCVVNAVNNYYGFRFWKEDKSPREFGKYIQKHSNWINTQWKQMLDITDVRAFFLKNSIFARELQPISKNDDIICCGDVFNADTMYERYPAEILLLFSIQITHNQVGTLLTFTPHSIDTVQNAIRKTNGAVDRMYILNHKTEGVDHAIVIRKDHETGQWWIVDSLQPRQVHVNLDERGDWIAIYQSSTNTFTKVDPYKKCQTGQTRSTPKRNKIKRTRSTSQKSKIRLYGGNQSIKTGSKQKSKARSKQKKRAAVVIA